MSKHFNKVIVIGGSILGISLITVSGIALADYNDEKNTNNTIISGENYSESTVKVLENNTTSKTNLESTTSESRKSLIVQESKTENVTNNQSIETKLSTTEPTTEPTTYDYYGTEISETAYNLLNNDLYKIAPAGTSLDWGYNSQMNSNYYHLVLPTFNYHNNAFEDVSTTYFETDKTYEVVEVYNGTTIINTHNEYFIIFSENSWVVLIQPSSALYNQSVETSTTDSTVDSTTKPTTYNYFGIEISETAYNLLNSNVNKSAPAGTSLDWGYNSQMNSNYYHLVLPTFNYHNNAFEDVSTTYFETDKTYEVVEVYNGTTIINTHNEYFIIFSDNTWSVFIQPSSSLYNQID